MADFIRGQKIRFTAVFTDADGASYTPTAAIVAIKYPSAAGRTAKETIALSDGGSGWTGLWDSSVAAFGGEIYWTVYASAPSPQIANDGKFTLGANPANLAAI